jgi:predicted phosphodiesterase
MPRGSRRLPDTCLRELDRADFIFHAGDFTAPEVLDDLLKLAPVEAVHGNMDAPELRRYCRSGASSRSTGTASG